MDAGLFHRSPAFFLFPDFKQDAVPGEDKFPKSGRSGKA